MYISYTLVRQARAHTHTHTFFIHTYPGFLVHKGGTPSPQQHKQAFYTSCGTSTYYRCVLHGADQPPVRGALHKCNITYGAYIYTVHKPNQSTGHGTRLLMLVVLMLYIETLYGMPFSIKIFTIFIYRSNLSFCLRSQIDAIL